MLTTHSLGTCAIALSQITISSCKNYSRWVNFASKYNLFKFCCFCCWFCRFNSEARIHAHLKRIRSCFDRAFTGLSPMLRNFRSSRFCSELRLLGCWFMRPQRMPCGLFLFVGNMQPGIFRLVFHFHGSRQIQCILSMPKRNVFISAGSNVTKNVYLVSPRNILPAARGKFCRQLHFLSGRKLLPFWII